MTVGSLHKSFNTPLGMDELRDAVSAPASSLSLGDFYRGGLFVPTQVTGYNYNHFDTRWVDYGSNTTMFEQYSTTTARCYWGGTTRYNGPMRSSNWYPFDPDDTSHPDWGLVSLYRKGPNYFGDFQGFTFWNIMRYDPVEYQELANQDIPASGQISFLDFIAYGITVDRGVTTWELGTTAYTGYSYNMSSYLSTNNFPKAIAFSYDGTRLYFMIFKSNTSTFIMEHRLSTPWDIATASWTSPNAIQIDIFYGDSDASFNNLTFKPDGTKMYVAVSGVGGISDIREYNLSTPHDLTTASYLRKSTLSAQPYQITFSFDGTILTIMEPFNSNARQYQLSTPWDITTQTELTSRNYNFNTEDGLNVSQLDINSIGTKFLAFDNINHLVYEYRMTDPHDISTAVYQSVSYSPSESTPTIDFSVAPNGKDFYVLRGNSTTAIVYQYRIV